MADTEDAARNLMRTERLWMEKGNDGVKYDNLATQENFDKF